MDSSLLVVVKDGIANLTLNRPSTGNALDMPLARELLQAAIRCDQDRSIRSVVLSGNGRLFCGGGDIQSFIDAGDRMPSYFSELAGVLHMAVTRFMRMPKPLLVVVNGPAAGAGLGLAAAGDIVIAARSAHFSAGYINIGLSPDVSTSWHLPRLIGMRKAQDMLLTNRRVSAIEAEAIGLITRAVEDSELENERQRYTALLAGAATEAIGLTRNLLSESFNSTLEYHLEREARSVVTAARSKECAEGIRAFLEKRKPDFAAGRDA
ncbi:MAG: enoyl-CoA hydratase/isomerase family protein [Phreatobacter sp.]|uniref:enoyl-CoA hydratase/isomerase family protein n=1 Tax=Phreatobacter sp. TaxID=1966341 RepID=UPI001A5B4176|nr:enoyl-CoA hydratase-related protein [Phreatobacter sp.]MBL8569376.1 enoyl-CoA hydratase/isomerase family protein [Phreatobacter sp.]